MMSFNLEGRGGNQVYEDGKKRRARLAEYLESLCKDDPEVPKPAVLLTQEDMDAPINSCYTAVASCESEEYWWQEKWKFGDGKHMLNRVYIRNDLGEVPVSTQTVALTTAEMHEGGLNPRCAAVATVNMHGKPVAFASFHLPGGYVDDELFFKQAQNANTTSKPWLMSGDASRPSLRAGVLETLSNALKGTDIVLGGDTNGFPKDQIEPCQGERLEMLVRKWADATEVKSAMQAEEWVNQFESYLAVPAKLPGPRPLQRKMLSTPIPSGQPTCTTVEKSTTVWGGQPDQFFTNMDGEAKVLAVGLANPKRSIAPPYERGLSDHNPIIFEASR